MGMCPVRRRLRRLIGKPDEEEVDWEVALKLFDRQLRALDRRVSELERRPDDGR